MSDSTANASNKVLYIDVLTLLSSVSVVYLHTNGIFWSHTTGCLWVTANLIETFFYFAVPFFFMISGLTLIDFRQHYDVKTYLIKRSKRTVIPFIFWSLFGFFLYSYLGTLPKNALKDGLFWAIFNAKIVGIFWFFLPFSRATCR